MPDAPAPQNGVAPPPPPAAPQLPGDDAVLEALAKGTSVEQPGAKPADKKPEEPKKPEESALLRNIQKRERDLVTKTQQFQAQIAQTEAGITQKIEQGIEKGLRDFLSDPRKSIAYLQKLGYKPQDLADALVKPDAPDALELARKATQDAADLRKQIEDQQKSARSQQNEQHFQSMAKDMTTKGELKYLLLDLDESELVPAAYKLIAELKAECEAKGLQTPQVADKKLLQVLDKRAKARIERIKAKSADDTTKQPSQEGTKATETNGSGNQGATPGATSTTTLGKNLGERQTLVAPDPVMMSDADVIAQVQKLATSGFTVKPR